MKLDIKGIADVVGLSIPFEYELDLSELELYYERPFKTPVVVKGDVRNHAGMIELHSSVDYVLETRCARCLKDLSLPKKLDIFQRLAFDLQDEENDDILLIEGFELDVDEILTEQIIFSVDMSYLCSEDCRGLCPKCGTDLNRTDCGCEKEEVDERLAALKSILKDMTSD